MAGPQEICVQPSCLPQASCVTLGILSLGSLGSFKFGAASTFKAFFLQHLAQHLFSSRGTACIFVNKLQTSFTAIFWTNGGQAWWRICVQIALLVEMVNSCLVLGRGEGDRGAFSRQQDTRGQHTCNKVLKQGLTELQIIHPLGGIPKSPLVVPKLNCLQISSYVFLHRGHNSLPLGSTSALSQGSLHHDLQVK